MNSKSNKSRDNQHKKTADKQGTDATNDAVGNYEKHPFFVTKANKAKSYLAKTGLPKQLATKSN